MYQNFRGAALVGGTPDEVSHYVRELIRDLGPAGLVMKAGCDVPFNSPRANVEAMVAATRQYGRVSSMAGRR